MRANELIWENTEDTEMIKRKAVRMMIAVLQQYKDKKWLPILKANLDVPTVRLSVNINEEIDGLFSSYPGAQLTLSHVFITTQVYAIVNYSIDITDRRDWDTWAAFTEWLYNMQDGKPIKTPEVKERIKQGLLESGYFDLEDVNEAWILGTARTHLNVSFPTLKADLRAISDEMVKISDMLSRYNAKFDYFSLAQQKLGIS